MMLLMKSSSSSSNTFTRSTKGSVVSWGGYPKALEPARVRSFCAGRQPCGAPVSIVTDRQGFSGIKKKENPVGSPQAIATDVVDEVPATDATNMVSTEGGVWCWVWV